MCNYVAVLHQKKRHANSMKMQKNVRLQNFRVENLGKFSQEWVPSFV